MEKNDDGWIAELMSVADLSIDDEMADRGIDVYHLGRLLWPCAAYAEVPV